ncbi:MAG: BatD family protein [Bacteroidota bacterium]
MKNIGMILLAICLNMGIVFGQEDGFYLEVSSDTVLAGNMLQVSFVANNISGQFESPNLDKLNVVSGPNSSSSFSMVNGAVTQRASYSYNIYLEEIGEVFIPPAYLETEEGTLETEPMSVVVLPNPEGIIEQPPSQSGIFEFSFPNRPYEPREKKGDSKTKKKKRKIKRI